VVCCAAGVDPGSLPSLDELRGLLADSMAAGPSGRAAVHSLAQQDSSVAAGEGDVWGSRAPGRAQLLQRVAAEPEAVPYAASVNRIMSLLQGDESGDGLEYLAASGPLDPAAVLEGYLQASEGARPTDPRLALLTEAVGQLEGPAAVGASFPALMGPLLQMGLLSSRQVYQVTSKVEAARWGGRMPLLGPSSTTAKAALSAVELSDFHRCVAHACRQHGGAGLISLCRQARCACVTLLTLAGFPFVSPCGLQGACLPHPPGGRQRQHPPQQQQC
jgi:hypothetical protein